MLPALAALFGKLQDLCPRGLILNPSQTASYHPQWWAKTRGKVRAAPRPSPVLAQKWYSPPSAHPCKSRFRALDVLQALEYPRKANCRGSFQCCVRILTQTAPVLNIYHNNQSDTEPNPTGGFPSCLLSKNTWDNCFFQRYFPFKCSFPHAGNGNNTMKSQNSWYILINVNILDKEQDSMEKLENSAWKRLKKFSGAALMGIIRWENTSYWLSLENPMPTAWTRDGYTSTGDAFWKLNLNLIN